MTPARSRASSRRSLRLTAWRIGRIEVDLYVDLLGSTKDAERKRAAGRGEDSLQVLDGRDGDVPSAEDLVATAKPCAPGGSVLVEAADERRLNGREPDRGPHA